MSATLALNRTQHLARTGVAMLPGCDFGCPPTQLTARIAYVDFDGARALAAADLEPRQRGLSRRFVEQHAGRVLQATERTVEWLTA